MAADQGGGLRTAGSALTLMAIVLLSGLVQIGILSSVGHLRTQQLAYADFRYELANGTAPVGQLNPDGLLYPFGTAIAVLDIPTLGMHEVVFEGTTPEVLRNGPGHRRDTSFPGQEGTSVLMARRAAYGGPFGKIDQLQPGDQITVTTGQGKQDYRVLGVRRAGDQAPLPLNPGQGRLTLVTADGDPFRPSGVLRVDAELVSKPVAMPSRPLRSSGLEDSEQAMANDKSAWIYLVLWTQALALAAAATAWAAASWGRAQAWLAGVPVLVVLGLAVTDQVALLLPNLM
ncbi:MAG TPA: class E sortase [Kribbella sp.]|nr:class E sortase [Kribbella sp.]